VIYNAQAGLEFVTSPLMDLLKSVTGKVVAGACSLAVVAGGISWWQMDESTRQMLLSGTGKIISWLGIVLLAPWATFFITSWVNRLESNAAGAALVAGYTLLEGLLLAKLFNWQIHGATAWTFLAAGTLFGGVYNLLACDWIAEKLSS
jgi:FtsH-binding integral membrane protein